MAAGAQSSIAEPSPRRARLDVDTDPKRFSVRLLTLALVGGLVELALLAVWQRNGYWDFSDGVYAQSARELLEGLTPYRDFAAAQPPPVYLVGAALLVIHDGLSALRLGLGLLDLLTAALVGVCTWRLSRRRWLAIAAAAACPLLPISLHEHAQLTPETLAAPLLLGGALWCARRDRAVAGGMLLAIAAACKLAFFLPALAIVLAGCARRRALCGLLAAGALLGGLALAVFGVDVWQQAVDAQIQVGTASLHYVGGLLSQAAWNELPLLAAAAAAVWMAFGKQDQVHVHDRVLMRTLTVAAVAGDLLVLTVLKDGSYINVLAVAEPALLALAACGAAWSWGHRRRWRALTAVLAVLLALLAAQSISLLAGHASIATRPGAQSGLAWQASPAAVTRAVLAARRCPAGRAYSGDPYIAFLADRKMPGNQPDLFMIQHASSDARFASEAAGDQPRCP